MRHDDRALVRRIAELYEGSPDRSHEQDLRAATHAYVREVERLFGLIAVSVDLVPYDPYPCASVMRKRVLRDRRLLVSTLYNDHPSLPPSVNLMARAVHDVLGHLLSGADFTITGEATAFASQARFHSPSVLPFLFCEIVGQAAVCWITGRFQEQKVVMFDDDLMDATTLGLVRPFPAELDLEGLVARGLVSPAILTSGVVQAGVGRTRWASGDVQPALAG